MSPPLRALLLSWRLSSLRLKLKKLPLLILLGLMSTVLALLFCTWLPARNLVRRRERKSKRKYISKLLASGSSRLLKYFVNSTK